MEDNKRNLDPLNPLAEHLEKARRAADIILDHFGVRYRSTIAIANDGEPDMLSALVSSEEYGHLTINRPLHPEKTLWTHQIIIDNIRTGSSGSFLIRKDDEIPSAEMSFSDGSPTRDVREDEAEQIAGMLGRVAGI